MVKRSVTDSESGAFLSLWPLDLGSGMGTNSRFGSGMNIPDHIFDSSETIFWVKILKFFDADPDPGSGNLFYPRSGMKKNRIRDKHPRSVILVKRSWTEDKTCLLMTQQMRQNRRVLPLLSRGTQADSPGQTRPGRSISTSSFRSGTATRYFFSQFPYR